MPRVLRIINRFNLGGPTFNAALLTKYLAPKYETLLVGGLQDDLEDSSLHIIEGLNLQPILIPEMFREIDIRNDFISFRKLKEIIREFNPDIVHTHASKAGALGRLAAIQMKVPVIVHTFHGHVFHSYFGNFKTFLYKTIERYLANRSSCIIAISEKQKQELVYDFSIAEPDKVKVIKLGFDLQKFVTNMIPKRKKFRSHYGLTDDIVAIGIVGRLVSIKNHSMFLEAIKFVKEKSSQKIRAFIVGDGDERMAIEEKALALGLTVTSGTDQADVVLTSWVKEVDEVNAGIDIIALTSKNEGTPVSLIEAQASNKPIVTTNVGGIEDIVIPNETALMSSIDDKQGFNQHLLNLVENSELRELMGQKGWDFVKDQFHYQRLMQDMDNLYTSLL